VITRQRYFDRPSAHNARREPRPTAHSARARECRLRLYAEYNVFQPEQESRLWPPGEILQASASGLRSLKSIPDERSGGDDASRRVENARKDELIMFPTFLRGLL
jgi:hypothetical protein